MYTRDESDESPKVFLRMPAPELDDQRSFG